MAAGDTTVGSTPSTKGIILSSVLAEDGVFARKRGELHRDYCVRLPPGLYIASTHHGRAQGSVHLCNERGPWQLPASCQGGGVDARRTPNRREKLSDRLSRASIVAGAPTRSLRRHHSSGWLLLWRRAGCATGYA